GDARGAQDPEVGHAPLRPVLGEQQHPTAVLEARVAEVAGDALHPVMELAEGEALFAISLGHAEVDAVSEGGGGAVQELDQIPIGLNGPAAATLLLESGEDPPLEPGEVDVEEVGAPVDRLR